MQTVEDLIAVEEIKQLKARYVYALDTKDWAGYANTFTADAEIDFTAHLDLVGQNESAGGLPDDKTWRFIGGAALAEFLAPALEAVVSVHHCHDPQITLTGPVGAIGIWAIVDRLETVDELFLGYGHYHEEYSRTDFGWRISKLTLSRILGSFQKHAAVRYPTGG